MKNNELSDLDSLYSDVDKPVNSVQLTQAEWLGIRDRLHRAEWVCKLVARWDGNDSDFVDIDIAITEWLKLIDGVEK